MQLCCPAFHLMLVADFVGLQIFHDVVVSFVLPFLAWTKGNKL